MALGSMRVSMVGCLGISFTLVIAVMSVRSMMLYMRVMTNHMRAVMNLSVFFLTMSVGNMLTLLNISGVYNMFTLVMFLVLGDLVALVVLLVMTTRTTGISMVGWVSLTLHRGDSAIHKTGGQEEN